MRCFLSSYTQCVALYGGAFNPPHLAHLFAVQYLLTLSEIDEVWITPSARHAFGKEMVSFDVRVEMLNVCVQDLKNVHICRVEDELLDHSGRTFDTLNALSMLHPHVRFVLVIGADNLTESHRWHRFDELVERWSVIALGRSGHEEAFIHSSKESWCTAGPTLPSISSTELRDVIQTLAEVNGDTLRLSQKDQEILRWFPQSCYPWIHHYSREERDSTSTPRVLIWGQGRVGRALESALINIKYQVRSISLRSMGWIKMEGSNEVEDRGEELLNLDLSWTQEYPLWFITSRDAQLSIIVDHLLQHFTSRSESLSSIMIAHCSGSMGSEILNPLHTLNAQVAQLHPLRAIRGPQDPIDFVNIAFLIDGGPSCVTYLKRLVHLLGGWTLPSPPALHQHEINDQDVRALYHCAAVFASNLPVALIEVGLSLFECLGWTREDALKAIIPLAQGGLSPLHSLSSNLHHKRFNQALEQGGELKSILTGPAVRHDLPVIQRHW